MAYYGLINLDINIILGATFLIAACTIL